MRSLLGFSFCLAFALLSPSLARAADKVDDALRLIDRGTKRLDLGDYRSALKLFSAAQTIMPDKPNPYRLLGIAHARLGECAEASANFDIFLKMVPPTDSRVEEVKKERDSCKEVKPDAVAPMAPSASLAVESTPPGAAVHLDGTAGAPAGQTPYKVADIAPGPHKIALSLSGYEPASQDVEVKPGELTTVAVALRKTAMRRYGWIVIGVAVGVLAVAGATTAILLTTGRDEPTLPPIMVTR